MKIAAFILSHDNPALTTDTADSVQFWMTKDLFILVDAAGWQHFDGRPVPHEVCKGLHHGQPRGPFRNIFFGLTEIHNRYPDADWYCCMEQDCLVISDLFQADLEKASSGKWFAGTNYRPDRMDIPFLDNLLQEHVRVDHYVLGCLMFFHRRYVRKLLELDLPNKFLRETEHLRSGEFPGFRGFSVDEQLFPSLSQHLKPGSVFPLSVEGRPNIHYMTRWQPELNIGDIKPGASILHPVKRADSPIRLHYRKFRENVNRRIHA